MTGPAWAATRISQAPLPGRFIWDVSPLPGSPNTLIVVMSGFGTGHVWRGVVPAAGAAAWTDISGSGGGQLPDIPVNSLVIDPVAATTMYIGTDVGVFRTTNGGAAWTPFSDGLPNCAVFDMRLFQPGRLLRAALHGRGLWEKALDVASTPAVDLFVRDHIMDSARVFPTPSNIPSAVEDPLQHVTLNSPQWWWMCVDAKVDALEGSPPSYQMPAGAVDYLAFEAKLEHRNPQRGRVNRVYVQVHNRGYQPASNVRVKVMYADASAGLPPLPGDFWTNFPGDPASTAVWHPIGAAQTIATVEPLQPSVIEWEWTTPATAAAHTCLLIVMDCASDPIPAVNKVFDVGQLVTMEKRVGLKNLHVIDADSRVAVDGASAVVRDQPESAVAAHRAARTAQSEGKSGVSEGDADEPGASGGAEAVGVEQGSGSVVEGAVRRSTGQVRSEGAAVAGGSEERRDGVRADGQVRDGDVADAGDDARGAGCLQRHPNGG